MTCKPDSAPELSRALFDELETLEAAQAERLTSILRGLFSCMQDLNERVAILEARAATANVQN